MDIHDSTTQYAAGGTAVALVLAFILYQPSGLVKWLQKKNYQYEVSSSLYMLTPTEKFVFNSVLFLTLSLLTMACVVYLPDHISTMSRRTYYYFAGEGMDLAGTAKSALGVMKNSAAALAESASPSAAATASAIKDTAKSAVADVI
ncbi:Hypothetical protein R9X50_00381500 [Acrodontium crateriforme]|uniref:Uncharacterized protein n=1 Tax=Acrodontium crateriforme TaxID=150365 RepID=A0AAQ3R4K1_9PEZI|nr:Hypothetical protein R9X50_00381500 [Acrodontium crateriforme]